MNPLGPYVDFGMEALELRNSVTGLVARAWFLSLLDSRWHFRGIAARHSIESRRDSRLAAFVRNHMPTTP